MNISGRKGCQEKGKSVRTPISYHRMLFSFLRSHFDDSMNVFPGGLPGRRCCFSFTRSTTRCRKFSSSFARHTSPAWSRGLDTGVLCRFEPYAKPSHMGLVVPLGRGSSHILHYTPPPLHPSARLIVTSKDVTRLEVLGWDKQMWGITNTCRKWNKTGMINRQFPPRVFRTTIKNRGDWKKKEKKQILCQGRNMCHMIWIIVTHKRQRAPGHMSGVCRPFSVCDGIPTGYAVPRLG